MMPRAILFDLDGTLIRLRGGASGGQLARLFEPLAPILPDRDARAFARRLWIVSETPVNYALVAIDRLGLEPMLRPLLDRARRSKGIGTLETFQPIDGCRAALDAVASRYALGVLTNRARREAVGFVDAQGLRALFSVVLTRQDVRRLKPHPAPILQAAEAFGVLPAEVVMVGDMDVDMLAAKRAGATAVGVLTGFSNEAELRKAGADDVLGSVAELPAWLDGSG